MTKTKQSFKEPSLFPQTIDEFYQSGIPDALIGFVPVKVVTSLWEGDEALDYWGRVSKGKKKPTPTRVIEGGTWLSPEQFDVDKQNSIDLDTRIELDKYTDHTKREINTLAYEIECYLLEPDNIGVRDITIDELSHDEKEKVKSFYERRSLTRLLPTPEKDGNTSNISLALVGFLAHKKEIIIDGESFVPQEGGLTTEAGRKVNLTKKQVKLIAALASYLSPHLQDKTFRDIVENYKGGDLPLRYAVRLYISNFVKEYVSTEGKAKTEEIKKTLLELKKLSKIRASIVYGDKGERGLSLRGNKFLFTIDEDLSFDFSEADETNNRKSQEEKEREREELRKVEFVTIVFNPIFWYELTKRYSVLKKSIFRVWGTKGSGTDTELFAILLFRLLGVYMYKTISYYNADKKIDKRKYQGDRYKKKKIEEQINALKYEVSVEEIKESIPTKDYSSDRRYKSLFWKDLDGACKVYENPTYCGVITRYEADKKEGKIIFYINPDYYPTESKKIEE